MSFMVDWWTFILESVADFLMTEPVCYAFGMVLLVFVLNFLKSLFNITK